MVAFHAASCGYFFCVRFPGMLEFPRDIYDDIRDIYILAGELHMHPYASKRCVPCPRDLISPIFDQNLQREAGSHAMWP